LAESPSLARCLSFGTLSPDGGAGCQQYTDGTKKSETPVSAVTQLLSQQALRKRVERLMKAKEDGTLKVPEEIVKEWRNGNQQKLLEDFKEAGLDKDLDPCYPLAVASQSGFPISKTDVI